MIIGIMLGDMAIRIDTSPEAPEDERVTWHELDPELGADLAAECMEGADVVAEVPSDLERRLKALEHANKPKAVKTPKAGKSGRGKAFPEPPKGTMQDVRRAREMGWEIPKGWHHASQETRDAAVKYLVSGR
jgi:hypothetical protein